jgi:hypothetical protein
MDIPVEQLNINHLQAFLRDLEEGGKKCVETMAITGQSLVQHRIQTKGVGGRQYSRAYLPVPWFEDKALNAGGRELIAEQKESHQGISYYDWRVANGLQVRHVDLTFTGRMFGGTRIVRILASGSTFVAQVGGTDEEVDAKLGYAVYRYGPEVFDPSPEEQKEVDEIAEDFLSNLFNEYL